MIITPELMGATRLGELWYREADRPEGPWVHARSSRALTSRATPTTSTSPTQHPILDRDGGRVVSARV